MDKYLVASILCILANQAAEETKQLFLQNRFGLYDPKNHIVRVEHNFKVRLRNEASNKEPLAVGVNNAGNSNAYLGYEEIPVSAPRFREKKPIQPSEILAAVSGGDKTDTQEIMRMLKGEMNDLFEIPNFSHEIMVARCLQNATLKYNVLEGTTTNKKTIDLKSPTGHIVTYAAEPTKKVVSVIKEGQKKIGKRYKADTLILGADKVDAFFTEVGDKLNQRYMEGVVQKLNGLEIGGYRYHGVYDGMDVFEYIADYQKDATTVPLIDPKNIIVTSTQMKWKKYFGAVLDSDAIKENKHVGKAYSKSWEDKDPSQTWLLIETVSIPVPEDASGIYCATMA